MLTYGEKRGIEEIKSILDYQWKNGMVPHIRFIDSNTPYSPDYKYWKVNKRISGNKNHTSGITQPPLVAYALYMIYKKSKNKKQILNFTKKVYKKIRKYHDFLLRERDPQKENLVCVIHPWETGTDNSPYEDAPLEVARTFLKLNKFRVRLNKKRHLKKITEDYRPGNRDYESFGRLIDFFIKNKYNQKKIIKKSPYVIQDVMFNSFLAASVLAMSRLAEKLSKSGIKKEFYKKESKEQKKLYNKIKKAIQTKLFDTENRIFYSYDLVNKKLLKTDTIHSLSPLFGKVASKKQAEIIIKKIFSKKDFSPEKMIASTSVKMPEFDNIRYWLGPIWPVTNWIIYRGLRKYNKKKAEILRKETIKLIEENMDLTDKKFFELASSLMDYNSVIEGFTTPSTRQYCHGWLWDSCFAAIGWTAIKEKPKNKEQWKKIRKFLHNKKVNLSLRKKLKEKYKIPLFDEYYAVRTEGKYKAGQPIGTPMMTWTAALYLALKFSTQK
jgi:hypothetical protein